MGSNETIATLFAHHFSMCWTVPLIVLFFSGLLLAMLGIGHIKARVPSASPGMAIVGCLLVEIVGCLLMPRNFVNVMFTTNEAWVHFHDVCKWSLSASYAIPMGTALLLLAALWLVARRPPWPAIIGAVGITAEYASLRMIM